MKRERVLRQNNELRANMAAVSASLEAFGEDQTRLSKLCARDLRELLQNVEDVAENMHKLMTSKRQAMLDARNHELSPK